MIEVHERQLIVAELELELAALEDLPVLIAQNRQQQLPPQLGLCRIPVDIEEVG